MLGFGWLNFLSVVVTALGKQMCTTAMLYTLERSG